MFRWRKLGKIFSAADAPQRDWLNLTTQAPHTLAYDDFIRVYFSTRSRRDAVGNCLSYSAFFDVDRRDPSRVLRVAEQPILPLGGLGCFDEFGTYPVSPLRMGDEVWAYYAGWTRCESVPVDTAIGLAVSRDDGVTFRRLADGPLLAASPDEPFCLSGPKVRCFAGKYYLFYIAGQQWLMVDGQPEFSTRVRVAVSTDGLAWERCNRSLIPNTSFEHEAQASPDVCFAGGKYHMFFCHWDPLTFRTTRSRTIGYAWSEDLLHWSRDDARAGIGVSPEGFDAEMIAYPHVFTAEGKTYMLYLGNGVGRDGIGLAELEGELA